MELKDIYNSQALLKNQVIKSMLKVIESGECKTSQKVL